jgi:predicted AAA+ superfamily ATPase
MRTKIQRDISAHLLSAAKDYPVITLTGPRQSGKTTLCRMIFPQLPYANLEDPEVRAYARDDAKAFLGAFPNGAVIDEFQHVPDLASYIQIMVDNPGFKGTFVLTGSQNLAVRNSVSQSLAGRTAIIELLPLSWPEVAPMMSNASTDQLLFQGFYPRIYDQQLDPSRTLSDYIATYVERDLRQISMIHDLSLFQKFLGLCAGRVGQVLNLESLGNDTGISQTTARQWLSLLEASYIGFRLQPYFANISKRLIKTPKFYFYDVGLAAHLMGICDAGQLRNHPLRGMLFENMVVVEIKKHFLNQGLRPQMFFYRDSNGIEVDLVLDLAGHSVPIEIKSAATLSTALFKGIEQFMKIMPSAQHPALVYDGTQHHQQRGAQVLNFRDINEQLKTL